VTKPEVNEQCGSPGYHNDLSAGLSTSNKTTISAKVATTELTLKEFCSGVKHEHTHYMDLKVDRHFNSRKYRFVAMAFTHPTQQVLNADYKSVTARETGLFKEMQICMYAVYEDKLQTNRENCWSATTKSFVMLSISTNNLPRLPQAPQWYRFLVVHCPNASLVHNIPAAGAEYSTFVLHWSEQISLYERFKLDNVPPNQIF
jgi:hypothetical protein